MAIRAVVFDFDGTLMDTESCAYDTICSIYAEHGGASIGNLGGLHRNGRRLHPYRDLEMKTGRALDHEELRSLYRRDIAKM